MPRTNFEISRLIIITDCLPHLYFPEDPLALISQIKAAGMKAGIAISPDTPSSAITDEIAAAADMILVMTVYPGESNHLLHLSVESLSDV